MKELPRRILAFDPGGTTGVAEFYAHDGTLGTWQIETTNHHRRIWRLLYGRMPEIVVTERFDYRPRQSHAELISVEYIGVLRLWCAMNVVPLVEQTQLKGHKGLWTDDKFKEMKLYKESSPHAMDALRQLMHYHTTNGDERWINLYSEVTGNV